MSAKTRRNPSANGDNRLSPAVLNPVPPQPGDNGNDTRPGDETPVSPPETAVNSPEQGTGTETPAAVLNPAPSGDSPPVQTETPAAGRKPRDKRENYNPAADTANLSAIGFSPADGGNWYTAAEPDGAFFALERVVAGGRYYLIRYVQPAGSRIPRPLFRTPFEPVFYPR